MELLHTIQFQMSLLLFVSLAGYLLAARINQSAVVGEIILGLIIGPSLLGFITYTEFIANIAELGAIILLFVVGLEFKLDEIINLKYSVIAFFGVIIPWVGGYLVSKMFGFEFGPAVFIATALTATSIAITANVLKEMGKLHSDAAKAIIGAAVIDDILSLIALTVSTQVIKGSFSFGATSFVIIKSLLFLIIGVFIGYTYITYLIGKIDNSKLAARYPELVFIFAIMFAFLYAMIAEVVGLSPIIGAFVAGVSLEEAVVKKSKNYRDGADYVHIIFASIFFVSLGILADFKALTFPLIFFIIALTLVAIITKMIGCGGVAKLLGLNKKDSLVVGIGMSPRGEVAMIVALIGLNAGLITQGVYVTLISMSLLTTLITPILLRRMYRDETCKFVFKN